MIPAEPGATLFGSKFASRGLTEFARSFPDLADRLGGAQASPERFVIDFISRLDRALRRNEQDELLLTSVKAMSDVLGGAARSAFMDGLVEDAMLASKDRMSESRLRIVWG
ncbi:MAG: hypothetical protein ACRD8U_18410, partial [Pyrinomonadaceae bacterium]